MWGRSLALDGIIGKTSFCRDSTVGDTVFCGGWGGGGGGGVGSEYNAGQIHSSKTGTKGGFALVVPAGSLPRKNESVYWSKALTRIKRQVFHRRSNLLWTGGWAGTRMYRAKALIMNGQGKGMSE